MSDRIYRELDKNTLSKLHDTELEILQEIDRICKKNNINFFLVGGTLLGAVRHKGFIPWDDDLDIGMFREDYDRFIDIAIKEIDDKYFVHCDKTDKHYWLPFCKVKKNNTTFIEEFTNGKKSKHSGVFVDIFPVDKTGANYNINRIKGLLIRNISDCLLVKEGKISLQETRHFILGKILTLFSKEKLIKIQNGIINKYQNDDYVVGWIGVYHIKKELLKKEDAFPLVDVVFENKKYKAYNNYDYYLRSLYGNYMELPPVEERINHGAVDISFTKGDNIISKDVVDKS